MIFSAIGSALGFGAASAGAAAGAAGGAAGAAGAGAGITGAIGTAAGVAGQVISYVGNQKAEALRKRQMNLTAEREKRATIREAVATRASAMVQGEAQGARGSSALAGGLGQISASAASNVQGINQSQQIGNSMFKANSMISAGQTISSIGGAFNDISSKLAQNADQNYRVWGT